MGESKRNLFFLSITILLILNILAWSYIFYLGRANFLEITFLNIGQGDATFIEAPGNYQILIDGGPGGQILEKLRQEIPPLDKTIDLIILTHPDKDHLFGLNEVLKTYHVENIIWTGVEIETEGFQEWKELIKEEEKEGAKIYTVKYPQKIIASDLVVSILYPTDNLTGRKIENSNDTSIISKLNFGKNSILFTGDATEKIEKLLISLNTDVDSDILKISHHGSQNSTSDDFLKKVSPQIAIISVGKNSFGHPSEKVLDRLNENSIKILRTDQLGDIKIIANKKIFVIKTQN
jgi:competence protein ComEC